MNLQLQMMDVSTEKDGSDSKTGCLGAFIHSFIRLLGVQCGRINVVLLDGFPFNVSQAKLLGEAIQPLAGAIHLNCPTDEW